MISTCADSAALPASTSASRPSPGEHRLVKLECRIPGIALDDRPAGGPSCLRGKWIELTPMKRALKLANECPEVVRQASLRFQKCQVRVVNGHAEVDEIAAVLGVETPGQQVRVALVDVVEHVLGCERTVGRPGFSLTHAIALELGREKYERKCTMWGAQPEALDEARDLCRIGIHALGATPEILDLAPPPLVPDALKCDEVFGRVVVEVVFEYVVERLNHARGMVRHPLSIHLRPEIADWDEQGLVRFGWVNVELTREVVALKGIGEFLIDRSEHELTDGNR
jgi:hypothetical protein